MSKQQDFVLRTIEERGVKFVRLWCTDVVGTLKMVAIAPADLLVMTLAPDRDGNQRQVTIQLMPPPFSQGWVGNIRKLAAAKWWDGTAVVRVQDNYVAQWGDPTEKKPLPEGLATVPESDYVTTSPFGVVKTPTGATFRDYLSESIKAADPYAERFEFVSGMPFGYAKTQEIGNVIKSSVQISWPVHCYGMVGVGRNLSPDTGSGAELYTVIGHAPRQLDRNIAVVGRVIEGIEHLSALPRGKGEAASRSWKRSIGTTSCARSVARLARRGAISSQSSSADWSVGAMCVASAHQARSSDTTTSLPSRPCFRLASFMRASVPLYWISVMAGRPLESHPTPHRNRAGHGPARSGSGDRPSSFRP